MAGQDTDETDLMQPNVLFILTQIVILKSKIKDVEELNLIIKETPLPRRDNRYFNLDHGDGRENNRTHGSHNLPVIKVPFP